MRRLAGDSHLFFFLAHQKTKAREQEVIFFNILSAKEAFLGPEVAISRVLITLDKQ